MKKSAIISKLILLVLFLTHNVILAQNQVVTVNGSQIQVSSTLQSVLNQVESIYLKPISGIELSNYLNRAPVFVPMFIGLVMQRQEMIMRENITEEHLNNFTAFEEEIFAFLEQLAEAHNNSSPVDNSFMPSARLKVLYQDALKGNQNEVCKNDFGIDPATIETAYLLEGFSAKIYGRLIIEDEEPTEINLFGEVAPHADLFPSEHKDRKKWDPSKSFSSDIIVGTWYSDPLCTKSEITFAKGPKGYTARSESEYSYTLWEVRRVKGDWDQPEKKMYWNEYYIATRWFISKADGSKKRLSDFSFYIKPYRDTMVLQQMSKSYMGYDWEVYKPF